MTHHHTLATWAQEMLNIIQEVVPSVSGEAMGTADGDDVPEDTINAILASLNMFNHYASSTGSDPGTFFVEFRDNKSKGIVVDSYLLEEEGVYIIRFYDEELHNQLAADNT